MNMKKINIKAVYGKTHKIETIPGTTPDLTKLKDGQFVVAGGKNWHYKLTPNQQTNNN